MDNGYHLDDVGYEDQGHGAWQLWAETVAVALSYRGEAYRGLENTKRTVLEGLSSGELSLRLRGILRARSGTVGDAETHAKCVSTCPIVGLFVGFVFQHSFTNFQVLLPNPICSALPGLVGRVPSTTRHTS